MSCIRLLVLSLLLLEELVGGAGHRRCVEGLSNLAPSWCHVKALMYFGDVAIEARFCLVCGHGSALKDPIGDEQLPLEAQSILYFLHELFGKLGAREERGSTDSVLVEASRLIEWFLEHEVLESLALEL